MRDRHEIGPTDLPEKPIDHEICERTARALQREGREVEAVALLVGQLRNLTGHVPPPLPCLCKRCLDPQKATVEHEGALYDREFAVAGQRVLFFWVPRVLGRRRRGLRRAVAGALEDKLRRRT